MEQTSQFMKALRHMVLIQVLFLLATQGLPSPAHGAGCLLDLKQEESNVIVNFTGQLQSAGQAEGPYTSVLETTRLIPLDDR